MGLACWEAPHWGGLFVFPPEAKAGAVPVCALPSRYLLGHPDDSASAFKTGALRGLGPEMRARAVRTNGGETRKMVGAGAGNVGRFQLFSCHLGRTLRQSRQIDPVPAVRIIGKNPQSSSSMSDLAMKWT